MKPVAHKLMTGLKWGQLRHWRRLGGKAPVVVSLNGMPRCKFPVVDFEVGVDGGSFGTMNGIGKFNASKRADFIANYGRVSSWGEPNAWDVQTHARKATRAVEGLGRIWVAWVGPLDMMVEDFMLAKTGLTVEEHQRRTVENYVALVKEAPTVPWLPVLQGQTLYDYLRHVAMYREAGVDLTESEWVGVGSMCRRQSTREAVDILVALIRLGLRVHALGVKVDGLRMLREALTEREWTHMIRSDSAAWSKYAWKKQILLPGHYHGAKTRNCANCPAYARVRLDEVRAAIEERAAA